MQSPTTVRATREHDAGPSIPQTVLRSEIRPLSGIVETGDGHNCSDATGETGETP